MSRARKISTLVVLVGALLPIASLVFISGYNPAAGFLVFALGCFLVCLGAAGFWFSSSESTQVSSREGQEQEIPNPPDTSTHPE